MANGRRLVGAVNAVERGPEIERPCAERVVRAARHMARQIGTAQQHLGRRRPIRPFGLAADPLDARPFEAGAPNALLRRGFNKQSLLAGTVITVEGYQAKDGAMRANGRDITYQDGRKLFVGSSGTGAPDERPEK